MTDAIRDLAAAFDKRAISGCPNVAENLAELRDLWPAGASPAENAGLLRIIAGGCGPTAFAMAAELAGDGNHYAAAVLLGLAERAYQLAVQSIKDRAGESPDPARLPGTQFTVARMRATVNTMAALLTHHSGPVVRYYLAGETEQVVSAAYGVIGCGDTEAATRIGQIWHDIKVSAPPFDADLARELIGKAALGIDPNETPRWL